MVLTLKLQKCIPNDPKIGKKWIRKYAISN